MKARTTLTWLCAGLSLTIAVALVLLHALGFRAGVAASASMEESGISIGTAYVLAPINWQEIDEGDIINARKASDGKTVTHLALATPEVDNSGRAMLRMQGSSNVAPDLEPYDVTDGAHRLLFVVPGLGEVQTFLFVTHVWLGAALIAMSLLLLVVSLIPTRKPSNLASAVPSVSTPSTLTTSDDESETTDDDSESVERPAPVLGHWALRPGTPAPNRDRR